MEGTLPLALMGPTKPQSTPETNVARRWPCERILSLLHTNLGLQQFVVSLHGQEAGLLTNAGNQRPSPSDKVYLFPSDTCQLGQATPTTTSPLG